MTTQEREKKLKQAEQLILEVRDDISNESVICKCCGFRKFISHNNHQLREQLNGAITRIVRVYERAERTEGLENHPRKED